MLHISKRHSHSNIINLLETPPSKRTDKQVSIIMAFLSRISYFKPFMTNITSKELSTNMTVTFIKEGEPIFQFGESSEAFYYIIEGQVEVQVPYNIKNEPVDCYNKDLGPYINWKQVEIISEGGTFGELGLLIQKPRAATVVAINDTVLAVCDKKTYLNALQSSEQLKLMKLCTDIEQVLSSPLNINRLIKLSVYIAYMEFKCNDKIFEQGQPSDYLYLILSGDIKVP